jgi:hypothetical protein
MGSTPFVEVACLLAFMVGCRQSFKVARRMWEDFTMQSNLLKKMNLDKGFTIK